MDRDGTINEEIGYLSSPDHLALIPGAAAAIRALNERGIATCVISNQSGVARGYFPEAALGPIHEALRAALGREGARIDRIYYCPHHPVDGIPPYNVSCDCRKPATGMLRQGARECNADLRRSFTVGDRIVDIQAGKAAGTSTILVLTGYGGESVRECAAAGVVPDLIVDDLAAAVAHILKQLDGPGGAPRDQQSGGGTRHRQSASKGDTR
jgi:D-glycero-D-manno-heptose 1,7-bisphosphate phosphatase